MPRPKMAFLARCISYQRQYSCAVLSRALDDHSWHLDPTGKRPCKDDMHVDEVGHEDDMYKWVMCSQTLAV